MINWFDRHPALSTLLVVALIFAGGLAITNGAIDLVEWAQGQVVVPTTTVVPKRVSPHSASGIFREKAMAVDGVSVVRVRDTEERVVCYVMAIPVYGTHPASGAISCLREVVEARSTGGTP